MNFTQWSKSIKAALVNNASRTGYLILYRCHFLIGSHWNATQPVHYAVAFALNNGFLKHCPEKALGNSGGLIGLIIYTVQKD